MPILITVGYCVFNDVAVAAPDAAGARPAHRHLDCDVHRGNNGQPSLRMIRVFTFSVHAGHFPFRKTQ
jgi:acetoin utilization deacetylase AcuC-like enzyme